MKQYRTVRGLVAAMIGVAAITLSMAACSGAEPSASTANSTVTSTAAPTTQQPTTSAPDSSPPPPSTTAAPETTTSTAAPAIWFEFRQMVGDADTYTYDISYPILIHPDVALADAVNRHLVEWAIDAIDALMARATPGDTKSTFTAQVAPELVSDGVFSLSGVTFSFVASDQTSASGRIGWIFSLADGRRVATADLFVDGDLTELAAIARAHLITDVLGDESAIIAPDGLLPEPANFDAVWLTPDGVGVGFDQYQVAAGDAGSPAVFITFTELEVALDKSGVLAPLQNGSTLLGN